MNQYDRLKDATLVCYKRGGVEEIDKINKELKKEEFIIMVCGIPLFFLVLFIGAYFTNGYFTGENPTLIESIVIPMIIFVGMLGIWFFVHLASDARDDKILRELRLEKKIK